MAKHVRFFTALIFCALIVVSGGNMSRVEAQGSPTKPILVVVNDSAANKFGRYLGEILIAEGLNSYDVTPLSAASGSVLSQYKVVVLAETSLSATDAATFSTYVNGGGYLIAMRPDSQIAGLFGLGANQGTQTDGYLKMNGSGVSQGLSTATLQIHGTVDKYATAGATTLAQLYSSANSSTAFPAVAQSANAHATAFLYDLAYNVVYTRQGNPANANVDTDGDTILRTIDLFQSSSGTPWVDRDKMPIPQADEQQRLFARLVQEAINAYQPMPQLWYFPGTSKTVLISTADAHANPTSWYQSEIDTLNNYNAKATFYIAIGGGLMDSSVQAWRTQGHEFGIHPYAYKPDPYPPFNITNLAQGYSVYLSWYGMTFSSAPSRTVRNHQVAWSGWTDAADIAVANGMGMDTNFYAWGPWLQKQDGSWARGYVNGSGQPMKFMKADGTILPYYQQVTQLIDEQLFQIDGGYNSEGLSTAGAIAASQQLIDASEAGDYAAIMTQFHVDYFSQAAGWVDGTLAYAQSKGIPMWNADNWLSFTETRHDATYTNLAWNGSSKTLSFNLAAASSSQTLSTVLPLTYGGSSLQTVTVDGAAASFSTQTIKGTNVAFITVPAGNHSFTAVYSGGPLPTNTPTITATVEGSPSPTLVPTNTSTVVPSSTPTNTTVPTATATVVAGSACLTDDTVANFSLGTTSGTFVSEANGGQLILNPTLGSSFSGTSLPVGWVDGGTWQAGGATTVSGSNLLTNRSRAGSSAAYAVGASLEVSATFQAAAWQHIGWVGDLDFSSTYAIFSTFNTSNSLYARTSDGTNFLIAGNWVGSAHRFRIDHTATSFVFYIDGAVVATLNYAVSGAMQAISSENSGLSLPIDWAIVTPYAASGLFTSRVFDASVNKNWGAVTWTASGSTLSISARSGNTAAPDGTWSAFTPIAASGSSANLTGRYIQYQASLSTANTAQTPVLDVIAFACTDVGGSSTATVVPSNTPTVVPTNTAVPTTVPTNTATVVPSSTPTVAPTNTPVVVASNTPTVVPTNTAVPTNTPTVVPTNTAVPTNTPTVVPTNTLVPTATATVVAGSACLTDDTIANFSLGTTSGTFVSEANGGQLILNPTLGSTFTGTSLPSGWVDGGAWQAGGATTVSGSNLLTNRSRAGSSAAYAVGASLEVSATFQAAAWQHVGWVGDLDFSSTYAIFSTFNTSNSLYARTSDGTNFLIAGNWIGTAHRYRIDHTATSFVFYIDGAVVATLNYVVNGAMQVIASENSGVSFPIDWALVTPYASSGLYTSRVFDAGSSQNWGAVTWTASGSTLSISARSGNTAAPDGTWSAFTSIAASGSSANLTGRYIQYQASLSTANTAQTPVLDVIAFACTSTPVVQGFQAQSLVSAAPVKPIATVAPTSTLVPTATVVVLPTETIVPTDVATDVPTNTPEPTVVVIPTDIPTNTPEPTIVIIPTDVPTNTPEPTVVVIPTEVPTSIPAPTEVPPTAGFATSATDGVAPAAISFSNQSSGNITSYSWNFGDGGSSADANPSYTFNAAGVYTVTLTVSGPGGSSSAQTVITVN